MLCKICGDAALKNVVLVTNMWDDVSSYIAEARSDELAFRYFKPALEKGSRMVHHDDTARSAHDIIRMFAGNPPVVLQIQRELVDEHKDIDDTTAGEAINLEFD